MGRMVQNGMNVLNAAKAAKVDISVVNGRFVLIRWFDAESHESEETAYKAIRGIIDVIRTNSPETDIDANWNVRDVNCTIRKYCAIVQERP